MDYKSYFDIPDDICYLNTAGNGLMPRSHFDWRRQREREFFDLHNDLRDQQPAFIATVKREFADLFGCDTQNVYAVPNFSFALHSILSGLPAGLRILLLDGDYPSLNYPVQSRGFTFSNIDMCAQVEEVIWDTIQRDKPDVLMLSLVQYISGLKIDLDFVKRLKAAFSDLLIIGDATQYLGTEAFNFSGSGFDAVGGSGYKWLMAGFGNGYLMISEQLKEVLYTKARTLDRPREAMWANKSILDTFFEPGHQDTLTHGTLLQSVHFLKNIGLQGVKDYLTQLTDYAYAIFEDRGWLLPEIKNRKVRSTLINVQVNPDLFPRLMEEGVKCFPRGAGIRIGLHIYNRKADIDRFVGIIERNTLS
ncbi:aminotransferase class V-fold PLP-dependent enzyme [Sphingobacterium faecale]|uniref:Aminotransferase class V-fold PLP-dependent enzyme n=1 Tax=Sphingobacterium faecale TaxID=2803775 RepID=A0ABS1QZV2_9SPHI|nr:aminotransferase class V-fold PLP-dependent enzyme [Sphingobacterium faecale]MBL1407974.1 aminotransferase class V-fold PLP-dependent enzyme [Sphingobacterium faecale]